MMKKSILITLLAFGLVTGFLTSTVFAGEQTDQPKSEEKAEKGWQDALEAQAVLLKAWLAAEKEATYDQAQAYLDEAKAWYARAKEEAGEEVSQKIADIEKHIDKTRVALKKKTKEARQEIADLLKQAADIVKRKE
jgi:polyhydroxyalkanoate synthesis regulator phasin